MTNQVTMQAQNFESGLFSLFSWGNFIYPLELDGAFQGSEEGNEQG